TGKLIAKVLGKSAPTEEKTSEYITELYEIPIKHELGKDTGEIIYRTTYDVNLDNGRYDGDKFAISLDVYPSYVLYSKSSEKILDYATIKKDKEYKNDAACVRVFFPKNGDLLWDVAKKYHTTGRKIVEDNSLSSYSLDGVKSIII
ncbi:MAG: LysM peptidoglycan-binding domain-containing protein, partial [Clostridia bacterium]|nr:LysM peptidoglycan-binding domain-containing protein [Clostridia bacterium]